MKKMIKSTHISRVTCFLYDIDTGTLRYGDTAELELVLSSAIAVTLVTASMEHHEQVNITALPQSEACFHYVLTKDWGKDLIPAVTGIRTQGSHGC